MYFAKITSSWRATNSLQKYLEKTVKDIEKKTVEDPQMVYEHLSHQFALANQTYSRCKPEKVNIRPSHNKEDIYIDSALFVITFYKIAGDYTPAPVHSTKRLNFADLVQTAQPLTLFS